MCLQLICFRQLECDYRNILEITTQVSYIKTLLFAVITLLKTYLVKEPKILWLVKVNLKKMLMLLRKKQKVRKKEKERWGFRKLPFFSFPLFC